MSTPRHSIKPIAACGLLICITAGSLVRAQEAREDLSSLYRVQIGDELTIKVYERPELDETIRVRPDGRISVLLLDDVTAAGLTTEELDAQLTSRYREFYRDPRVTVIVRTFANQRVFVGGEVGRPGAIPLQGKVTVLGAVVAAGGFRGTAKTDNVVLIRQGPSNEPVITKVNLKDVINRGSADIELEPFDVVYVPMSTIAKMDKFVDQYIRQLLPISLNAGFQYILGEYRQTVPVVPIPP
jgi:protein involved in polysaccharide export with SLBB domain